MKSIGKSFFSLSLVLSMALSLLLTTACGNKPQPDPSQDNDVSTGVSQDENSQPDDTTDTTDEGGDATDESGNSTDESGDATDESGDTTDTTVEGDTTTGGGKLTTKNTQKGDGKVTTKTTTKKGDGKATTKTTTKKGGTNTTTRATKTTNTTKGGTTTTTKGGGGIIIDKTTTTTKKTTTTTTKAEVNQDTKSKILSMFDASMKGKTATVLVHFKATSDTGQLMQMYDETGVKVKFLTCDLEDYGTKLSALINATASPDVAYMTGAHYPSLVIKGFAQDLSKSSHDMTMDIFDKQMMDCYTWDGKKYGMLLKNSGDAHFIVAYYNKTIFNRKGVTDPYQLWQQGKWNWDTFLECAKQVNDSNNGVWGCELYASHTFLSTSGKDLVTVGDGVITNNLSDSAIVKAWNFVNKLHHVDKVTTGLAGAEDNFSTGKSVILIGESWMWGSKEPVGQTADEWGVVPAPCSPDIAPIAVASPRAAFIPMGCRNPDLGLAVYAYWTSNEVYVDEDEDEEEVEEGELTKTPHYPEDQILAMRSYLWEMPKVLNLSQGIIEYGGDYSQWDFSFDVFQAGISGITANMDKWKSAIDVNIKRILTEFS